MGYGGWPDAAIHALVRASQSPSGAEAGGEERSLIAAVNRCATQNQLKIEFFANLLAAEVTVLDREVRYNFASPTADAASRVFTVGDDVSKSDL
jgi:hypothetical protein